MENPPEWFQAFCWEMWLMYNGIQDGNNQQQSNNNNNNTSSNLQLAGQNFPIDSETMDSLIRNSQRGEIIKKEETETKITENDSNSPSSTTTTTTNSTTTNTNQDGNISIFNSSPHSSSSSTILPYSQSTSVGFNNVVNNISSPSSSTTSPCLGNDDQYHYHYQDNTTTLPTSSPSSPSRHQSSPTNNTANTILSSQIQNQQQQQSFNLDFNVQDLTPSTPSNVSESPSLLLENSPNASSVSPQTVFSNSLNVNNNNSNNNNNNNDSINTDTNKFMTQFTQNDTDYQQQQQQQQNLTTLDSFDLSNQNMPLSFSGIYENPIFTTDVTVLSNAHNSSLESGNNTENVKLNDQQFSTPLTSYSASGTSSSLLNNNTNNEFFPKNSFQDSHTIKPPFSSPSTTYSSLSRIEDKMNDVKSEEKSVRKKPHREPFVILKIDNQNTINYRDVIRTEADNPADKSMMQTPFDLFVNIDKRHSRQPGKRPLTIEFSGEFPACKGTLKHHRTPVWGFKVRVRPEWNFTRHKNQLIWVWAQPQCLTPTQTPMPQSSSQALSSLPLNSTKEAIEKNARHSQITGDKRKRSEEEENSSNAKKPRTNSEQRPSVIVIIRRRIRPGMHTQFTELFKQLKQQVQKASGCKMAKRWEDLSKMEFAIKTEWDNYQSWIKWFTEPQRKKITQRMKDYLAEEPKIDYYKEMGLN